MSKLEAALMFSLVLLAIIAACRELTRHQLEKDLSLATLRTLAARTAAKKEVEYALLAGREIHNLGVKLAQQAGFEEALRDSLHEATATLTELKASFESYKADWDKAAEAAKAEYERKLKQSAGWHESDRKRVESQLASLRTDRDTLAQQRQNDHRASDKELQRLRGELEAANLKVAKQADVIRSTTDNLGTSLSERNLAANALAEILEILGPVSDLIDSSAIATDYRLVKHDFSEETTDEEE